MRKILLALVVAFTTAVGSAASYDEEQLLGYWEVTQMDGYVRPDVQTFTGLYFGDVYQMYRDMTEEGETADSYHFWDGEKESIPEDDRIEDSGSGFIENAYWHGYGTSDVIFMTFSITNENKLHIDEYMQFKIEELTANSMKLVTYTSKKPCHITLRKTNKYEATVKAVAPQEENEALTSFDIEGRRISENQKGLVISGSKGKYRKIIRK